MVKAGIEHTLLWIENGRLFEHAYLQIPAENDLTGIKALLAGEHGEQRRFARTVLGNQSHFLSFGNRKTDVLEQDQCAKRFCQVLYVQIWGVLSHWPIPC